MPHLKIPQMYMFMYVYVYMSGAQLQGVPFIAELCDEHTPMWLYALALGGFIHTYLSLQIQICKFMSWKRNTKLISFVNTWGNSEPREK